MATPRDHIEQIRLRKYSVGSEGLNPLMNDLHNAVRHLSVELYSKDIHFLLELLQNAEDNEYPHEATPCLEFVISDEDVTGTGASSTLLVYNNEVGFSKANIESICSVGQSTKKGKSGGHIGEKGIGFKSVFVISKNPHIFSSGYKIKFSDNPHHGCSIGYIVPEWVEDGQKPTLEDIKRICGLDPGSELHGTVLILPLRSEKIVHVKNQLRDIHPEIILFLSKIRKLSVREHSKNDTQEGEGSEEEKSDDSQEDESDCEYNNEEGEGKQENIRQICVSKETEMKKSIDETSESWMLYLTAIEQGKAKECGYYMWRHRFTVESKYRVPERNDIDKFVITLAFPVEERLDRKLSTTVGIFCFLPTEIVSGWPFIIQADFILSSSRETIIFQSKWNKGIIKHIPMAFCSAFKYYIDKEQSAPPMSKGRFLNYLPIHKPSLEDLCQVRDDIRVSLRWEPIIFCENGKYQCPSDSWRILPAFREILNAVTIEISQLYMHRRCHIVHSWMENNPTSIQAMEFLEVDHVPKSWYLDLVKNSTLVSGLPGKPYVCLLQFIKDLPGSTKNSFSNIPILQYVYHDKIQVESPSRVSKGYVNIYLSATGSTSSCLEKWHELGSHIECKFMPDEVQNILRYNFLLRWIKDYFKVTELSVISFTEQVLEKAKKSSDASFIIYVSHFLRLSWHQAHLTEAETRKFADDLPIVDKNGKIHTELTYPVLLPKSISTLGRLLGTNLSMPNAKVIVLSESYLKTPPCAKDIKEADKNLVSFLELMLCAQDVQKLHPLDSPLQGLSNLPKDRAVLLLGWVEHALRLGERDIPQVFLKSVSTSAWLKTRRGFRSPSQCLMYNAEWKSAGIRKKFLNFVDTGYYKEDLSFFKKALQALGVALDHTMAGSMIAEQIRYHTKLNVIRKLYHIICTLSWKGELMIWIPSDSSKGDWVLPDTCICHDNENLFCGRVNVLQPHYTKMLLKYFSRNFGVPLHPTLKDYLNLWKDWCESDYWPSHTECKKVWENLIKQWVIRESELKKWFQETKTDFKLPIIRSSNDIEFAIPSQVFIPDNLYLKQLFETKLTFAWYPIPCDPDIPLDLLYSIYSYMGVERISQVTTRHEISYILSRSLSKCRMSNEETMKAGISRMVLAFLENTAVKLQGDGRNEILRVITQSKMFWVPKKMFLQYSVCVNCANSRRQEVKAKSANYASFDKKSLSIFVHNPVTKSETKLSKISVATDFGRAVAFGLLKGCSDDLVMGLSELLKLGWIFEFEDEAVDFILNSKNFHVSDQVETLLSSLDVENKQSRNLKRKFDELQSS